MVCASLILTFLAKSPSMGVVPVYPLTTQPNCPLWPLLMPCLAGPVPLAWLLSATCSAAVRQTLQKPEDGRMLQSTCKHHSALHWAPKCISDSGKQDVWRKNYSLEKQQLLCQLSGQHVLRAVNLAPGRKTLWLSIAK